MEGILVLRKAFPYWNGSVEQGLVQGSGLVTIVEWEKAECRPLSRRTFRMIAQLLSRNLLTP